jgi:tetratricopeptide (TPR) repeat protein
MSYNSPMNEHSELPFSFENSQTFIDLGWQLLYQDGRFEEAEQALQSALELDPGNVEAMMELADCYGLQDREQDELRTLKQALKNAKTDDELADVHFRLGLYYFGWDDDFQLQMELDALRSLNPTSAELLEEIMAGCGENE